MKLVDADSEAIEMLHGNKPGDLFPGYYPPTKEERLDAYRRGLVSLDANALLDLYRFSERARNEFFEVLEKLRPRLFITHQAALEFYRNRLSVVESRLNAPEEKCKEIEQPLKNVIEKIQEFANRYQIDSLERHRLIGLVQKLSATLTDSIRAAGMYDLAKEQVRDATDPVLQRLQSLLADRVGDALSEAEYKQAVKEALRRREDRIPPGYAEKKLSPELQAGDYLVWRELMNEASLHDRPVLLVTNEQKEDWVLRGPSNQVLGPRPELVLEMRREPKAALHMITVVGLLKEAPEYLGTTVSPSTIREAEFFPIKTQRVNVTVTPRAAEQYGGLSEGEKRQFTSALDSIYNGLVAGRTIETIAGINVSRLQGNHYVVRWSSYGRAIIALEYGSSDDYDLIMFVIQINRKKLAADSAITETAP